MNVILFFILLFVFFAATVILLSIASEFIGDVESPVRRWRKMHTPPCSRCGNCSVERRSFGHDETYCSCPEAVEAEERMSGRMVRNLPASRVRGGRYCRFVYGDRGQDAGDEENVES